MQYTYRFTNSAKRFSNPKGDAFGILHITKTGLSSGRLFVLVQH